ncbi:uncharacterized protein LOC129886684 isoform X1 [Solanum dulcamara]|uniref:uncharacterized protein LOC129873475 n=1 Tax=Solanum dulcamara TaxID=45834 RepID=UPI0024856356|nr:uncharacterized protein LOC129873475 [Solanum dulcamara]XP_055817448.1 uncharacterized protein LOC129886684 isoform X1 [Solanum dulcamara]
MSKLFGGKNPFDDPFFTEPFGVWNDPCDGQQGARKQITIEELNPQGDGDGGQAQENSEPRKDLVVNNKKPSKKANGSHRFSYRRVAYGGLNGMYYTCSEGRMTGPDGVVLAEMKEDDKTIGESLHTISKGIHNKGHSVTTKHSSGGREDTLHTLHNLNEDELGDFEQNFKANADKYLPGWDKGFSLLENQGSISSLWDEFANWRGLGGWEHPALEYYGNAGPVEQVGESGEDSSRRARRSVPVE